jgi:hypothetical protein
VFEPALRYASTFEADNDGCRGYPLSGYHGTVVLEIFADHQTALELSLTPRDLLGDLQLEVSPPITRERPSSTVCRWVGASRPGPGRVVASLDGDHGDVEGSPCAVASHIALARRCRSDRR